jgi:NaMN:DMB phosphoribosyltransferase
MRAVSEVGDPMMPAALGILSGVTSCNGKVVLCGGTQMAAVLALSHAMGIDGDISIATTKYIVEDKSANFVEMVKSLDRRYYVSDPGLERSRLPPIQTFAQGYVKEGVGAGGAAYAAGVYGIDQQRLIEETDRVLLTVELPKR